jgi:hypothetical protein
MRGPASTITTGNVEAPHRRRQRAMQDRDDRTPTRIKVAGVGGGGGAALNRMISAAVRGVEFIAVNTDLQALERCNAEVKVNVGRALTRGLGASGDWVTGQAAAAESQLQLAELVKDADMVFITAGMGGGLPGRRPPDQEPPWPSGVPARPRPRMGSGGAVAWPSVPLT